MTGRGCAVLLAAALAGPWAAAGEPVFDRGEALYENHCQGCHAEWAHRRAQGEVTTLAQLRDRVASWSVHSGLGWGDEEVDDVTGYLNRRFYQFEE